MNYFSNVFDAQMSNITSYYFTNINMRSCITNLLKLNNYACVNETSVRYYPRWTHRRPEKVLTPEEYDLQENKPTRKIIQPQNLDDNIIELNSVDVIQLPKSTGQQNKSLLKNVKQGNFIDFESLDAKTHFHDQTKPDEKRKKKKQEVQHTNDQILNTTFDKDGNYVYTKMKNNDPKIGTLLLMVKSRKLRSRQECILLEGKRLIKDALLAKCTIEHVLFTRKPDLDYFKDLLPKKNVQLYKIAYRDMQLWSGLTTSPGVMGIFKTPKLNEISFPDSSTIPLTIICDNVREPGNLGAILRASAAVGSEKIILTKGCVDLWEPKVLRSSCGAQFRAPVHKNLDWNQIKDQIPENSSIFLADNNILTSESNSENNLKDLCQKVPVLPYYGVDFINRPSIVLVIGGETLGLSEESYRLAFENGGSRLNIPLNNDIESLNTGTALGIIAFEIKRQLLLKR